MLVVVPAVLMMMSFLIVVLRLYTRFVLIRNVGADDWLIGASTVSLKVVLFRWVVEWRLVEGIEN